MKKSSFLTFIFACWPGAGQMYMGYTKRGTSLMTAFVTVLGIAGFLDLWFFSILLPVIWFFAFFDAFAIRNMTPEECAAKPDDFIVPPELRNRVGAQEVAKRYHLALGIGLIVIGVYILYNSFFLSLFANLLNAFAVRLELAVAHCEQLAHPCSCHLADSVWCAVDARRAKKSAAGGFCRV